MEKIQIIQELFRNRTYLILWTETYSFKRGRKWIKKTQINSCITKDVKFTTTSAVYINGKRKLKCNIFDTNTGEAIRKDF